MASQINGINVRRFNFSVTNFVDKWTAFADNYNPCNNSKVKKEYIPYTCVICISIATPEQNNAFAPV